MNLPELTGTLRYILEHYRLLVLLYKNESNEVITEELEF
jgi:hypothetical protein